MTRYGFAIDQRACIGCHACTVACKMENDVPLGVFRTWVKYVEKGTFPDAKRYFSVLRCNHCDDAPCVNICPTSALFKREDGIVDFDNSVCIGCKACMQACPYDALYLEPETQTAAKCNFCAHRVEVNLEPACVIVCPTHAIIAGDMDDPASEISKFLGRVETQVRAPEQGTGPNVYYAGADETALDPMQVSQPDSYMWAERNLLDGALQPRLDEADARAKATYDVDHAMPWGWKVTAYLWTKSIAAGAAALAAVALLLGNEWPPLLQTAAPAIALAMTALTGALLVADLKRPERFWMLIVKGNTKSWLVRGAYVLLAYGGLLTLWLGARILDWPQVADAVRWPAIPIGVMAAAYTGWLFGQAEGRDMWQSPVLALVLVAQAALAGSASLLLAGLFLERDAGPFDLAAFHEDAVRLFLVRVMVASAGLWAALAAIEITSHTTEQARKASHNMLKGPYADLYWTGVALAIVLPAALGGLALATHTMGPATIGAVTGLGGLLFYEHAFVKAGQSVPLS